MKKNMTKLFLGLTVLFMIIAVIFSACPNDTTTNIVAGGGGDNPPPGPVEIPIESISIGRASVRVEKDKAVVLEATIYPITTTMSKEKTWSSSNEAVATVSGGTVVGVSDGDATITVTTVNGKTDTCTVTVVSDGSGEGSDNIPVTGVRLITTDLTLEVGAIVLLEWEVLPANALNKTVTWIYETTKVEVNSADGRLRAINYTEGGPAATVTVKTNDGGFEASISVTINKPSDEYQGPENPDTGGSNIDDSGEIELPNNGGNATLKDDDLTLSVTIDGDDKAVAWQWYVNTTNAYSGATKIAAPLGTQPTYDPPTNVAGKKYYFVEVTLESGKKKHTAR